MTIQANYYKIPKKAHQNIRRGVPYVPTKAKNKGCDGVHSKRECERRKRQITRGSLKPENGLDLSFIPQYKFD